MRDDQHNSPISRSFNRGAPIGNVTARRRALRGSGYVFPAVLLAVQALILIVPQGFDYRQHVVRGAGMPTEGDTVSRFTWIFLLLGGLYLLIKHRAKALALLKHFNPFIIAFLGLATLSVLWSIEPDVTLRRVYRFVTVLVVCMAFTVQGWHRKRYQNVARALLTAILVASVIFVLVAPQYAVQAQLASELKGAWRGITETKNNLGPLASDALLLWLHAWLSKESKPVTAALGLSLSLLVLIKTRSDDSILASAFGAPFMLLLLRPAGTLRRYMPYIVGLFAVVICVYALAVLHLISGSDTLLSPVTLLTGKSLTFSNRTAIWAILEAHIRLHPWLGTGYGAYWYDSPNSPSQEMVRSLYFYPTEGHNGYLDVINDTGYVGFGLLIAYFISYLRQSLYVMRHDKYQAGLYLTLIFTAFLSDLSESHWFNVLQIGFLMMTLATAALAKSYLQARAGRQPPFASNAHRRSGGAFQLAPRSSLARRR
jgi:exopolysaccharide production protein ExoQ